MRKFYAGEFLFSDQLSFLSLQETFFHHNIEFICSKLGSEDWNRWRKTKAQVDFKKDRKIIQNSFNPITRAISRQTILEVGLGFLYLP